MNTYIKKKNIGIRIGTDGDNDDHIRQFKQISKYIIDHPNTWFIEYIADSLETEPGKRYKPEQLLNNTSEKFNQYRSYCFLFILKTIRYVSGLCRIPPSR